MISAYRGWYHNGDREKLEMSFEDGPTDVYVHGPFQTFEEAERNAKPEIGIEISKRMKNAHIEGEAQARQMARDSLIRKMANVDLKKIRSIQKRIGLAVSAVENLTDELDELLSDIECKDIYISKKRPKQVSDEEATAVHEKELESRREFMKDRFDPKDGEDN